MSSSRNISNKKNLKLFTSIKQTTNSSNKRISLILSDLCVNSSTMPQRKSLTTMADTKIG